MKGAQAILETLHRGGVDTIFANPGTSEMHFVAALDRIRSRGTLRVGYDPNHIPFSFFNETGELVGFDIELAQGLAEALGIAGPVVSPTFTLAREYAGRLRLVHLDVYRLDRVQELLDLGVPELADDDAVVVVEWGDVVTEHLPPDRLDVRLEPGAADDERVVTLAPHGPSWSARAGALARAAATAGEA